MCLVVPCISCITLSQQPDWDGARLHCLEALQCKLKPSGCHAAALRRLASAFMSCMLYSILPVI